MKSFKLLLFSLSLCITLLFIYIVQFVISYKLLYLEYLELFVVIFNSILLINCFIYLIIKWIINYYITPKLDNIQTTINDTIIKSKKFIFTEDLNNQNNESNWNTHAKILTDKQIKYRLMMSQFNFPTQKELIKAEYFLFPELIVLCDNKQYQVVHKFRTDLSDKDIYGTKWDYLFIKEL